MLFSQAAGRTMLSRAFTGRLGRGLSSRIATDLFAGLPPVLPFPLQTTFMSSLRKAALERQKWDLALFWGGQIAPLLRHTKAAELVRAVVEEAAEVLEGGSHPEPYAPWV
jgi:nitronate monooxygenase